LLCRQAQLPTPKPPTKESQMQTITQAIKALENVKDCYDLRSAVNHVFRVAAKYAAIDDRMPSLAFQGSNYQYLELGFKLGAIRSGEGEFICAPDIRELLEIAERIEG
jgi:hypothetical protein